MSNVKVTKTITLTADEASKILADAFIGQFDSVDTQVSFTVQDVSVDRFGGGTIYQVTGVTISGKSEIRTASKGRGMAYPLDR
jgi:hypothetical protein